MKPEQICPGKSYKLVGGSIPRGPRQVVISKVKDIRGNNVVVLVDDREVEMPIKDFASLAVSEVREVVK